MRSGAWFRVGVACLVAGTGACSRAGAGDRGEPGRDAATGANAAASGSAAEDSRDAAADGSPQRDDAGPDATECQGSFRHCLASRSLGMHDGRLDIADIDGDGRADALALRDGSAVWIATGDEPPVSRELEFASVAGQSGEFVFADVTGDGAADQVGAVVGDCADCSERVTLSVARGDGRGGFAEPEVTRFCSLQLELRVFDLDGDAIAELVTNTGCPDGEGVLTVFDASPLAQRATLGPSLDMPTGGDVDGDGIVDLAAVEQGEPPELVVRPGLGEFAFGTGWRQPLLDGALAVDLETIDLDGDAFADLLVLLQESQRTVIVAFRGSAEGPRVVPVGPEALPFVALDSLATELIVADADGDCRQEALLFVPDAGQSARIVKYSPLSGEARALLQPDPLDIVQLAGAHAVPYPTLFGATAEGIVELLPSTCGPPN